MQLELQWIDLDVILACNNVRENVEAYFKELKRNMLVSTPPSDVT